MRPLGAVILTQATKGGLSGKQLSAIAASHKRVTLWDGAVRSGKTFAWIFLILSKIQNHSGVGGIVIVGKNRDSIYRNVFEPIEQNDEFALFRGDVKYRQGAASAVIFGRRVHVIGANDAGSESRIRGMTLALAFADELTVLHVQFFKQLLARLSVAGAQLFGTTNPDTPGHWLMTDYLSKIPGSRHFKATTPEPDQLPDWLYRHFTMEDNPSLSEDYKASLRREYTGVWFRRFILGEWVAADGAIYDFFDTNVHTITPDKIPTIERTISLGIDYGTTHPTAGMLLGLGKDDTGQYRLYVTHEWAPNHSEGGNIGLTDGALSADLKRWLADKPEPEYIYVDPAAKSFRLQLYDDKFQGLQNAKNDVLDGIRTVATELAKGNLLVSTDCERLIEEIPGYRWDDKATERGEEKPIKVDDDYCDSLRYAVFSTRHVWSRYLRN